MWINFDPQAGKEQAGRRPGLVISPKSYNARSGLALVCPITSKAKNYLGEVPLAGINGVTGVVLADHIKSLDWRIRQVTKIQGANSIEAVHEVSARLAPLLG